MYNIFNHKDNIFLLRSISPSLCVRPFFSLRSDLRTSLRKAFGPRRRRRLWRPVSSLPNSLWPSPHRQSVSVWLVCFHYGHHHVVFHSNEQCLPLCLVPPLPPNSTSISILLLPSATKGKNITHPLPFSLYFSSHPLQHSSTFLYLEDTLHIYIIQ